MLLNLMTIVQSRTNICISYLPVSYKFLPWGDQENDSGRIILQKAPIWILIFIFKGFFFNLMCIWAMVLKNKMVFFKQHVNTGTLRSAWRIWSSSWIPMKINFFSSLFFRECTQTLVDYRNSVPLMSYIQELVSSP